MAHPMASKGKKGNHSLLRSLGGPGRKLEGENAEYKSARSTKAPTIGVSNLTPDGKKPGARMDKFARGGKVGPTTNIIIATGGKDQGPGPMPMPMGGPPMPAPMPPMAGPRPAPIGMPPGPPPGGGMKFGGRFKRGGKVHSDEAQDRKLIKKMIREEDVAERKGSPFKRGGAVKAEDSKRVARILGRKDGGRVPHMTAGAGSGEGREEKIAIQKRVK